MAADNVNYEVHSLTINSIEFYARLRFVPLMRERRQTELPPSTTRRWTIRRKAAVLEALHSGILTIEQARERYALSVEEIRAWKRDLKRHGLYGLRATQVYREDR